MKHIFRAEPKIKVSFESEKPTTKMDALRIGIHVLRLHIDNLALIIDANSEDITARCGICKELKCACPLLPERTKHED